VRQLKRVPLKEGLKLGVTVLNFDRSQIESGDYAKSREENIEIVKILSRYDEKKKDYTGTSSLVYEGFMGKGIERKHVVVKEFYPQDSNFYISRSDNGILSFNKAAQDIYAQEYKARLKQFLDGYEKQCMMTNGTLDIKEFVVCPIAFAMAGDSFYIVSDIHDAKSLDQMQEASIIEKVEILCQLSYVFQLLEQRKEVFLDLASDNVMYIGVKGARKVKLFDLDSILDYSEPDRLELSDIRYHEQYASEILKLVGEYREDFDSKKRVYFSEGNCRKAQIYSLGILGYELIFGTVPGMGERRYTEKQRADLEAECRKRYRLSGEAAKRVVSILNAIENEQYVSAGHLQKDLERLQEEISKPYTIRELNYLYLSYNVLERFPVYNYAERGPAALRLEVSVIGAHPIRKEILKAVLPGIQMLDSSVCIKLLSPDAEEFWRGWCEHVPELENAVKLYINGKEQKDRFDDELLDQPLADVHLYTAIEPGGIVNEIGSSFAYVWCVEEDQDKNIELAGELVERARKGRRFIAYLDDKERKVEVVREKLKKAQTYAVCAKYYAALYDEKEYKMVTGKLGLDIHAFYYRGVHPRAAMSEIKKDYRSNPYSRQSSERSALHIKYKLASIGIMEWEDEKFLEKLYEGLFDLENKENKAKENFDRLVCLEHRSWVAFQIVNGWSRLDDEGFRECAYLDGNSWKDNHGRRHPYLVKSLPGRKLGKGADWGALIEQQELDPLDLRSVRIYQMTVEKAGNRREEIDSAVKKIGDSIDREKYPEVYENWRWMKTTVERCYSLLTSADLEWDRAFHTFQRLSAETGFKSFFVNDQIRILEQAMQPILDAVARRDIKTSDEDIVRAIPELVSDMGIRNSNGDVILIKLKSDKKWENVYSALAVRPSKYILLADKAECMDRSFYYGFFRDMGLICSDKKLSMSVTFTDNLRTQKPDDKILVDATGADPILVYRLLQKYASSSADPLFFSVKGRKIVPWTDKTLRMFQKPVFLTAGDTLRLAGAVDRSVKNDNYVTQLSEEQYQCLWNSYLEMGTDNWGKFIKILNEAIEDDCEYFVDMTRTLEEREYCSESISEWNYDGSGLKSIMESLEYSKYIQMRTYPQKSAEMEKVRFKTYYSLLGKCLVELLNMAEKDGCRQHFLYIREESLKKIIMKEDSLYRTVRVIGEDEKRVLRGGLERLNEGRYKDLLFQSLKLEERNDILEVSFNFASRGVRDVLKKSGNILKAVIYFDCFRKNIFDDLRMNSEFDWGVNRDICDEIDLIGVRNNKTYFISVNMRALEKSFLEEIEYLCSRFSIDGQAVLIAANSRTDTVSFELKRRGELMGIEIVEMKEVVQRKGEKWEIKIGETLERIVKTTVGNSR